MFHGHGPLLGRLIPSRKNIAVLVLLPLLVTPALARADVLNFVEMLKNGVEGVSGLDGVSAVALSPDGGHLYACSPSGNAVAVLRRSTTTGALTPVDVVRDGEGGVVGLGRPSALAVSPDGANVYVTGSLDDTVAVFRRDRITGVLGFVEAHIQGGDCDGLTFASAVTVSPDGADVYVAGQGDNAVAAFRRNQTSGALSFVGVQRDGVDGVDGLAGPLSLAISPDGAHLYVAGGSDNAVAVFRRDPGTGALIFVEVQKEGVNGLSIAGTHSVAVSSDGTYVYAAGLSDAAVAVFRRDPVTGGLTLLDVQAEDLDGVHGLLGAQWVTPSPDGTRLYVVGTYDNAVAVFDQDATTGALSFAEVQEGSGTRGLAFARSLAVSPDGRDVYVAGASSNAVTVFTVGAY
jgi:6-phosphogluconolactonase (cycloisomerase 2 family)